MTVTVMNGAHAEKPKQSDLISYSVLNLEVKLYISFTDDGAAWIREAELPLI